MKEVLSRLFLLVVFVLMSLTSYADVTRVVETVTSTDSLSAIAAPQTFTVYTKSVSLVNHLFDPVGVMYKASSSGTITLTIQAQQSYSKPTTEAVADAGYVSWTAPESISDAAWHAITLDTVTMPYLRFKIVGSGSNHNSTTIQIKVSK